jgi:hypothetical protein
MQSGVGAMAQAVQCLPSKYKVLSSNSSTTKKEMVKMLSFVLAE